jgi:hypothetical protein
MPSDRASAMPASAGAQIPRAVLARRGVVGLGLGLTLLLLTVVCARYLAVDAYIDHIEGTVVVRGWEWLQGAPLYEWQDGAPRFANLYGPLTYIAQVPALVAFGPGIMASKATALAALFATITLGAHWFFRGPAMAAVHALFLLVAGLTMLSPTSFWTRADPIETLLVMAAVVASDSPWTVGLCVGLAVNFKIHAFLYFLPILLALWQRHGWTALPPVGVAAAAAFVAPFLLPGVSLHDYLATLVQQLAGRPHHVMDQPAMLLGCLVALALPVALPLMRRNVPREAGIYGLASLATLVLVLYPATFPGAGPYHFLPLLPVLAEARRRLPIVGVGAEFAVFPMLLIASATTRYSLDQIAERRPWGGLADEAVALARRSPVQPAEIGYGDTRPGYEIAQLAKAKLALGGPAPWIDAQILMELRVVDIDGSARWVPYLDNCRVKRWVLPKDEPPFAVRNFFYDDGPLFDARFRAAFQAHYRQTAQSLHFAAWDCRP